MVLGALGYALLLLHLLTMALSVRAIPTTSTPTLIPTITTTEYNKIALVNPPLACPFTFQGAFLIGTFGTNCQQFSNSDGVTAIPYSAIVLSDPTTGFLPFIACALLGSETFLATGMSPSCAYAIVNGQAAVTFSTPDPVTGVCTTDSYRQMCVYPFVETVTVSSIVSVDITATGFINVPSFVTSTTTISATVTVTSTSTSTIVTVTLTTNTLTVGTSTETTESVTTIITQSVQSVTLLTLSTTTTTFALTTETDLDPTSTTATTSFTFTLTTRTTVCSPGLFGLKAAAGVVRARDKRPSAAYPMPYNFRAEQAQCPIPFAGSIYNSNPGSSVSTICNVAGATQLVTDQFFYLSWLWSMIKTYTPCAYASTDTVLWIGSSAGACYALSSTTLAVLPCSEIHPVICINPTDDPTDFSQFTFVSTTVTFSDTVTSVIVTLTSTIQVTRTNTQVSTVVISIPIITETTRTSTRNTFVTQTATGTRTFTGITVTTTTLVSTETDQTVTSTVTSFVMTRTVTLRTTVSTVLTSVLLTTETDTVQSCPETRTRTATVETTLSTVITNIVPQYITTVYTTESQCIATPTTTYATDCGC